MKPHRTDRHAALDGFVGRPLERHVPFFDLKACVAETLFWLLFIAACVGFFISLSEGAPK